MTDMQMAHYTVIRDGEVWQINLTGKNYGPYATQSAAIRDAIDTAEKAVTAERQARVMVQEENGSFREEWRSGSIEA
jgi:flavin-binding protein dodecin